MQKLCAGALPWLRALPERFQQEFEGIAEGAGIPLQRLAEWDYIEECGAKQCSGAMLRTGGRTWVARNNDFHSPELWGYVTIRDLEGRIPTLSFSLEGGVFTPTGINKQRLWLHYNYLPVWDKPAPGKPHLPPYVFLTEALERCESIRQVEAMLNEVDRTGGMLLFALDGKTDEFALFECRCSSYDRVQTTGGPIVATNHACARGDFPFQSADREPFGTLSRYEKMTRLVDAFSPAGPNQDVSAGLIRILADDEIERRDDAMATVYANVACPSSGEIWYTFGGHPAASRGNWRKIDWPWPE
jgi:hypothetical protein